MRRSQSLITRNVWVIFTQYSGKLPWDLDMTDTLNFLVEGDQIEKTSLRASIPIIPIVKKQCLCITCSWSLEVLQQQQLEKLLTMFVLVSIGLRNSRMILIFNEIHGEEKSTSGRVSKLTKNFKGFMLKETVVGENPFQLNATWASKQWLVSRFQEIKAPRSKSDVNG